MSPRERAREERLWLWPLFVALVGVLPLSSTHCARAALPAGPPALPEHGGFPSREARESACLDLQDHIVDLYAEQNRRDFAYEFANPGQWREWRDGYARELARKGVFERFEQSCFASLTPGKWECAMSEKTSEGATFCLRVR